MNHPTATLVAPPPPTPRGARARPRRRVRTLTSWSPRRVLVVLVAFAGIAVFLYPAAADWFSTRRHTAAQEGYVRTVEAMAPADVRRELDRAERYNRDLPAGEVADPYSRTADGSRPPLDPAARAYDETLAVGRDGMMGTLAIPSIDVSLPVYHGTADDVLQRGAGHLYGTALPVGGAGTHSVLTGHSGIPGDTLLTDLEDVRIGDRFTVTVLDRVLTYQVDRIDVVVPDDIGRLRADPAKDYLTLVTCTPTGVNSHRLLVRGERVPTPAGASSPEAIRAGLARAGFPWWLLLAAGGLALCVVASTPLAPYRERR